LEMRLSVSLAADAGAFLRELEALSAGVSMPNWADWRERCQSWKKRFPLVTPAYRSVEAGVHNYVLVDTIGRLLGKDDLVVPGSSGACSEVTCQALPAAAGIRFINTQGLGAMGFGVPAALGACLASGERRTVCIDGDGGFPMNAQELALIASLNLPIKFFVLDNAGYSSIRAMQANYFERRFMACDRSTGLALPDLEKLAQSAGIHFARIDSHLRLAERISELLERPGPVICDVVMAPDQLTQPKVSSRQQADGSMVTMPMEDLWPFLDRAEFDAIMAE